MDLTVRLTRLVLSGRVRARKRYATQAREIQERVLGRLVRRAADTEYGREHHFSAIRSYADFAREVPVNDYESLKDDIHRMRYGAKDVLWPGRVRQFAKSSGTTGDKSKFIPVTPVGMRRLHMMGGRDATSIYLEQHPQTRLLHGKAFTLSGSFDPEAETPYSVAGDISALIKASIPLFYRPLVRTAPPRQLSEIRDFEEKREKVARYLLTQNITSLSGVPSWILSIFSRALELSGKQNFLEVWPELELFVHGGVGFAPYRDLYRRLIPSEKMYYMEAYNATEGFFGLQDDPADPAMLLMIDYDAFYEFVPLTALDHPEAHAVPLWETKPGVNYAILVSTSCGLWRYLIGDTVRFTQKDPYKFVITGRTRQFINAFGEELIVDNAEKGIRAACEATGAIVREYTAAPVYMDGHASCRHQWLIEFERPPRDLDAFSECLDTTLQRVNSDYEAKRYKDITLHRAEVICARNGLFTDWLKAHGKLGGQHKIPRLNNGRSYIDELLAMNK